MDGRKRTVQIKFRVTEAERDLILEKMKLVPTRNMAAYLRKIAIDGYIIQVDHIDIKAMTAEIQKIGVNVNQIAKRVNSTGSVYHVVCRYLGSFDIYGVGGYLGECLLDIRYLVVYYNLHLSFLSLVNQFAKIVQTERNESCFNCRGEAYLMQRYCFSSIPRHSSLDIFPVCRNSSTSPKDKSPRQLKKNFFSFLALTPSQSGWKPCVYRGFSGEGKCEGK